MIRFELKRAFSNKYFYLALLIGCILVLSDVILNVIPMVNNPNWSMDMAVEKGDSPYSVYNLWIGGQARTLQSLLFYLIIPLIAALPFADSYCFDKTGYIQNIVTRASGKEYIVSKYAAIFLSAGISTCIPLILNFVATALFVPAILPQASSFSSTISAVSTFDRIFFTHPLVYLIIYLVIDFVLSGLIAEISLVATLFSKSKYVVLTSPFIVYILLYFVTDILGFMDFSVFQMLRSTQVIPLSLPKLFAIIAILFAATFIPYYSASKKDYSL